MSLGSALMSRYPSLTSLLESFVFPCFYSFHYRNLSSLSSQDAIFRIVAAVLHLGNIEFIKGVNDEMDSSEPKDEKSRFHLKTAAELLM